MVAGKPQVVNEVWDDARIEQFLHYDPCPGDPEPAFCILYRAYKYMRPEDFERFLKCFIAAGHDPKTPDLSGRSLAEVISTHRHGAPFIALLEKAQA